MRRLNIVIFVALALLLVSFIGKAQLLNGDAFLQGPYLEVGINNNGAFGTDMPPPEGYHATNGGLGFVADAAKDGWLVGTPNFYGDYFLPGSPEEGWGINYDGIVTGNFTPWGEGIPGFISDYSNTLTNVGATWEGTTMDGKLSIRQTTSFPKDGLYFVIEVLISNNSASSIPDVYYMRNVDPDNEVMALGGSYTTKNTIVKQPVPTDPTALVSAVGIRYGCYLGLGTKDSRARVAYGGFANRDAKSVYEGIGYTQTVGSSLTADVAMSLAYNLGTLNPGESASFAYAYILNYEQLDLALDATELPPAILAGGVDITDVESVDVCIGTPTTFEITNGSTYDWTWSPSTGLDKTTGIRVVATLPADISTITYTLTGTSFSNGTVVKNIHVNQVAAPEVSLDPFETVLPTDSPFKLIGGTPSGGIYSGIGVTEDGFFNPSIAGIGTFDITYTYQIALGCKSSATQSITVSDCNIILSASKTDISCPGGNDGVIEIEISGATNPVVFTWNNGATTKDISALTAGDYTLTVIDANSCSASVIVTIDDGIDNIAPLALAQDLTVELDALGQVSITPADIDNGSNDACGIADLTLSQTDFDCTNVGANTVTLTVSDGHGNTSTANAIVTVTDNIAPLVLAQDLTVELDALGQVSITPADIDNGSNDACGIADLSLSQTDFDCTNAGANTVTLTVSDGHGNTSTANAIVTVTDNIAPLALAQDLIVELDALGQVSITPADIDNGSNDACGIADLSLSQTDFDCTNVGANTVTLTVSDGHGNTSTANAIVTVIDNIAPLALAQDLIVELDALGQVSITPADIDNGSNDACGIADLSLSQTDFDCTNVGANIVTLTVSDGHGNTSTANAIVTVTDNIAPLALAQDLIVELDALGQASITPADIDNGSNDACGIADLSLSQTDFDCTNVGANTVTLTVSDGHGNTSTATATLTIEDKVAPVVITKDISVELDANGQAVISPEQIDNGTSDACGISSLVLDKNNFDLSNLGENTVFLIATDINGNESSQSAVVTVISSTVEITSLLLPIEPKPLDSIIYASATCTSTDLVSAIFDWGDGTSTAGDIEGNLIRSTHQYTSAGVFTVSLTVTNKNGNSDQEYYQFVVVYDAEGGFVTGGGWIWSKAGDYIGDPVLEGKANFGFVAKYKKGANIPEGNTEFKFKAGDLNFKSIAYEWLVVAGEKAKYKGTGAVNGIPGYLFMLSAIDGDSKDEQDKFRMKIWTDAEGVIYDNQPSEDDDADVTTDIAGGAIQIHFIKNNSARIASDLKIANEIIDESTFEVFPNPFEHMLRIKHSLEANREITVTMSDISGRTVLSRSIIAQGHQEISLDLNGDVLQGGVYFIHLNDGTNSRIFKMLKK